MSHAAHISRPARRDAGFTLLEMLVALMLVALAGIVALPLARGGRSALDIEASARDLANTLRATQSEAVKDGTERAVLIDVGALAFRREDRSAWTALPAGVTVEATVDSGGIVAGRTVRLRFHADGSASGGTIKLADRHRRMSILVDWLSGRVSTSGGG